MLDPNAAIYGRERELDLVSDFIGAAHARRTAPSAALVLEGPVGIGKTTIWSEATSRAALAGVTVRSCRCSASDSAWAFSGLGDLFDAMPETVLAELPNVQRDALGAALLLEATTAIAPGDRVVAVAVLGVLRVLARSAPLLLAIDDIQWLDSTSRTVLTYALRRLEVGLAVVASRRTGDDSESEHRADDGESFLGLPGARLTVGPVSVGALQEIVRSKLSMRLSRPTLTRLHRATGGNPMVSLEMSRALRHRSTDTILIDDPLPVPSDVRLLVADRLNRLSDAARDLLVVCAALAHPSIDALATAVAAPARVTETLTEVIELGLIEIDGRRVRFAHPLMASVAYADLSDAARARLHGRLAEVTSDPEERARHLALATSGRDAVVADALELAAEHARRRGSRDAAAEYAELSIGRTPFECADDHRRRRVVAAGYLFHLGYPDRARAMVVESQVDARPGPERVRGLLLLATIDFWTSGSAAAVRWCEQAMQEAGSDPESAARCHATLADFAPYSAVALLGHARTAVELLDAVADPPPDVLASALKNVAYHDLRLGNALSLPLLERAAAAEARSDPVPITERVGMCSGMLLRFAGQLSAARVCLTQMLQSARDEGDESALPNIFGHLALLECWAGDYRLALQHVGDGLDSTARTGISSPSVTAAHSLAEAHLGHVDQAREIAQAALRYDESQGEAADVACDLRSIGFTELSVGAHEPAAEHFLRAMSIAADLGVSEPAILRIHADAVEALVALGRLAEAEHLTEQLDTVSGADAAWSNAMAQRCRGLLLAADGELSAAADAFAGSLRAQATVGMPFEDARTRLLFGRVLRRLGRRTEARDMLEPAAAAFDDLNTPLYGQQARAELDRLGGRGPNPLTLTATEMRVAELVGTGRTNQEAAATLFISVRTVESHLGRIYRKLGLRSRTELAAKLSTDAGTQP